MPTPPELIGLLAAIAVLAVLGLVLQQRRFPSSSIMDVQWVLWSQVAAGFAYMTIMRARYGDEFDVIFYFEAAGEGQWRGSIGTDAVVAMVRGLRWFMPDNLWLISGIFAIPGALGRLVLLERAAGDRLGTSYVLFSPALAFFTSPIGKDGIMLLCLALLFTHQGVDSRRHAVAVVGSLVGLLLIRPHIAALAVAALAANLVVGRRGGWATTRARLGLLALTPMLAVVAITVALQQLGISLSPSSIIDRVADVGESLSVGTEWPQWFESLPLILRVPFSLLRPLNGPSLFVLPFALDTLMLLAIIVTRFRRFFALRWIGNVGFVVVLLTVLAFLPNEGLVLRQKMMMVPALIVAATTLPPANVTRAPQRTTAMLEQAVE